MPKTSKNVKFASAQDYALYLLSLKLQSVGQINEKLMRKGFSEKDTLSAINRLKELNYLNDEQFAQIYFDNLKKYKSFGYFGIKQKLLQRKIENKLVEKLLRDFSVQDEQDIAKRFLLRKANLTKEQKMRALQGRGFRIETILKILR